MAIIKRLLLPLIAALALPTAVNAESYWLVLIGRQQGTALEKIEMGSMAQCQEEGQKYIKGNNFYAKNSKSFHCVTGK